MRIDQPRQQGCVAQIDRLCSRWMSNRGTDLGDAFALHQNFAGRQYSSGFNIQQARGVQHNGRRRGICLSWRAIYERDNGRRRGICLSWRAIYEREKARRQCQ